MCGFCGVFFHPHVAAPRRKHFRSRLKVSSRSLANRGPDGEGFISQGRLSLAHRRLAIVDPTSAGQQPLQTTDNRFTLAVNGEIYNHQELLERSPAPKALPAGKSDSLAILALAEGPWEDIVDNLDGMFSFVLYDHEEDRLLLARDLHGQKPLFYYENEFGIFFGSTLNSLLPLLDSPTLSTHGTASYLLGQGALAPRTVLKQVRSLAPGEYKIFEQSLSRTQRLRPKSAADKPQDFDALFDQAVHKRLLGSAQPALLLSGGLDSAYLAESLSRQSERKVVAYCLGFSMSQVDERPRAERTAKSLGLEFRSIQMSPPTIEDLKVLAEQFGEPLSDSSALALFQLSALVSRDHKVAFSGDGGDELLGGYERHRFASFAKTRFSRLLFRLASWGLSGRKKSKALACARSRSPEEALYASQALASSPLLGALFSDKEALKAVREEELKQLGAHFGQQPQFTIRQRAILADRATNLPRDLLVKADRASMAHGLELRSPFLDRALGAWQQRCMASDRKFPPIGKSQLRKRLQGKIPQDVLNGRKRGFALPLEDWMAHGSLRDACRAILETSSFRNRELLVDGAVSQLFDQAKLKKGLASELIYAFTILELTMQSWNL